jgi:hypothetical protein
MCVNSFLLCILEFSWSNLSSGIGYPDRSFVWYASVSSHELLGSASKHAIDVSFHIVSNLSLKVMVWYEKDSLNKLRNKQISSLIFEIMFFNFVVWRKLTCSSVGIFFILRQLKFYTDSWNLFYFYAVFQSVWINYRAWCSSLIRCHSEVVVPWDNSSFIKKSLVKLGDNTLVEFGIGLPMKLEKHNFK